MADKISAENLFANTRYGLQRVYSMLNRSGLDGVSRSDIDENYNYLAYNDIPFAQFLSQNMNQIDTGSDGVISQQELMNKLNEMENRGITYEELLALQGNSLYGLEQANSSIAKLLENFREIDKNGDGRITTTEIKAYNIDQEISDKEDKYKTFKASDISIFYADSSSETSTEEESDKDEDKENKV